MKTARIDIATGQSWLAGIWFVGAAVTFVLMLLETMGPRAPLAAGDAWPWYLPLVVPTLSLMLGTIVAQAMQSRGAGKKATVGRPAFVAASSLSVLYLAMVLVLLVVWPLLRMRPSEASDMLQKSNMWLPAVQGLVGIALGAFFVSGHEEG